MSSMQEESFTLKMPQHARLGDPQTQDILEAIVARVQESYGVVVRIPGPTATAADEPFVVGHNWGSGRIPYWVETLEAGDGGGTIYAKEADKADWTDAIAVVRCTRSSEVNITVRFTRRPAQ